MSIQFSELAHSVGQDGQIEAEEILSLRQLGWGDGQMTREEAEALFTLNEQIKQPTPEWTDFFVEAVGEFVLNGTEPRGMCNREEAEWLIAAIDADGRLDSMAELEALIRIVERAQNVPDALKNYALKEVEQAVLTGEGATRCGGTLASCHVSTAECTALRRLIFASGGHGPAAVSRFDAEMLFRIKDATLDAANALEWQKLFVDGVANYLRGFTAAKAQLSHERMTELERFMADDSVNMGRFFGRMAKEAPRVANHFGQVFGKKVPEKSVTETALEGEDVTRTEREWLDRMIDADGTLDALEIKLTERIAEDLHAG
jgi:hypothetical protein